MKSTTVMTKNKLGLGKFRTLQFIPVTLQDAFVSKSLG